MRTLVYAVIAYFARANTVYAHTRTRVKLIQSHTRSFAQTQMHGRETHADARRRTQTMTDGRRQTDAHRRRQTQTDAQTHRRRRTHRRRQTRAQLSHLRHIPTTNAGYQHFLLFPKMFPKGFYLFGGR